MTLDALLANLWIYATHQPIGGR